MNRIQTRRLLAAAFVIALPASSLAAQTAVASGTPVTLVAASPLPDNARALVLHRRAASPRDVVLLDTGRATSDDLAAALTLLAALRARYGAVPSTDVRAVPTRYEPASRSATSQRSAMTGYLQALRAAAPRPIEAIGTAPALTITLPAVSVRRAAGAP